MPRIVDLSMPIEPHFRWKLDRSQTGDLEAGDPYQVTWMGMSVHAFTHIDSQRHIMATGGTTDDIPLEQVVGECAVVDLSGIAPNAPIEEAALAQAGEHIPNGGIVLLKTCWDRVHSPATPEFWSEAPYMTRPACQWLLKRNIRAIAYDFPQDYPIRLLLKGETRPFSEFVTHDVLLRNGVVMIEYLCNTAALEKPRTYLCALPLKIPASDGAPARVIAIEAF